MSLLPYINQDRAVRRFFNDYWRDFDELERFAAPHWRDIEREAAHSFGNAIGDIENTKEKFAVSVDVRAFKPEELKVDVQGRELTIKGDHEERQDSGSRISRTFVRKYTLPEDVNLDGLRPLISKEGKLTIEAPKRAIKGPQPRNIPIQSA